MWVIARAAAIDVARNSQIPIYIFSLREKGNIRRALLGEQIGSLVSDDAPALAGHDHVGKEEADRLLAPRRDLDPLASLEATSTL